MKTEDILEAVDKHHKDVQELEQKILDKWEEYAQALRPIKHRICVERFEIFDSGMSWAGDYDVQRRLRIVPQRYEMAFISECGSISSYTLAESTFSERIKDFCIEYLKSEEDAKRWHD